MNLVRKTSKNAARLRLLWQIRGLKIIPNRTELLYPVTRFHTSARLNDKTTEKGLGSLGYCIDLVKKHDYEGYLVTLILTGEQERSHVFALRAFNTEVSTIRDSVSQKSIGLGRLAFWRNAVEQIYGSKPTANYSSIPHHPCIRQLARAVFERNLSKKWLVNLMDSRERVMSDAPFKGMEDLEKYCDMSSTALLYLGLEVYGLKNMDTDHAASHMGKSIGLTNFVRSLPYNIQRRSILVPVELMSKHKVSQEVFARGKNPDAVREIVYEIAGQAHIHFEKATKMKNVVKPEAVPLFLSGLPSFTYLKKLQRADFNIFDSSLQRRDGLLPLKLIYKKYRGSYA